MDSKINPELHWTNEAIIAKKKEPASRSSKTRKTNKWIHTQVYDSYMEGKWAIDQEKIWSFNYKHKSRAGEKYYFRCNKVKKRGEQCAAAVYLLCDATSSQTVRYQIDAEHSHDSIITKSTKNRDGEDLAMVTCSVKLLKEESEDELDFEHSFDDIQPYIPEISVQINGPPLKIPKLRKIRAWRKSIVFCTLEEARDDVKLDWSYSYKHKVKAGEKLFYRCRRVSKHESQQCAAAMCLLCDTASKKVIKFVTEADHTHDDIRSAELGNYDVDIQMDHEPGYPCKIHPAAEPASIIPKLKISRKRSPERVDLNVTPIILKELGLTIKNQPSTAKEGRSPKHKKSIEWIQEEEYENYFAAKAAIDREKIWSLTRKHKSNSGEKLYYNCNLVKSRGKQCSGSVFLLCNSSSNKTIKFRSLADHNHDTIMSKSNEFVETATASKLRPSRKWRQDKVYESFLEAKTGVENEHIWSYTYKHHTCAGDKLFYRCNRVKKHGEQCAAAVYLLCESTSTRTVKFITEAEHTHDLISTKSGFGIHKDTKEEILKLVRKNFKPKEIILELAKTSVQIPKKQQLNNYLATLNLPGKHCQATISLGEMKNKLEENSIEPVDEHAPYVVNHSVRGTESNLDYKGFRFFIATKHLLRLALKRKIIHIDSTFKLLWQGYSVLIVGTTDFDQQFHAFGMAVVSKTTSDDFAFIFQTLREAIFKLFNIEYEPEVLISDVNPELSQGFRQVFGESNVIKTCWLHVKKDIADLIKIKLDKAKQPEITDDINSLQLASNQEIFERARLLFFEKWKGELEFCEFFNRKWVEHNCDWYEGFLSKTPSSNSSLETFCRLVKNSHVLRERCPLSQFISTALPMVKTWSEQYRNGLKQFHEVTTISLELWIKSYQLTKMNKSIVETRHEDSSRTFSIPAKEYLTIDCDLSWQTFDEYKVNNFMEWQTNVPSDDKLWLEEGSCNCPTFLRTLICKHIVGMAITLNLTTTPPEVISAINMGVEEKRKRGRPSVKAFLVE